MLYQELATSGIDYKPGDFKAEVHFLGQIIGATNVMEHDAIFVEAYFEMGEQWMSLSSCEGIQTQTCFVDNKNFACFCHPFDLHLTTENLFGWPRMIMRVWKLGDTNKPDLLSYGVCVLPNLKGYHTFDVQTWCLKGGMTNEAMWFFLESKPLMNSKDPMTGDLSDRSGIVSKPGPIVKISCEVIPRNFTFHSLSGVSQDIEEDEDDDD